METYQNIRFLQSFHSHKVVPNQEHIQAEDICIKSFMNIEIEKEKREREWKLIDTPGMLHNISGTYRVQCLQTHQIRRNTTWPGMKEAAKEHSTLKTHRDGS